MAAQAIPVPWRHELCGLIVSLSAGVTWRPRRRDALAWSGHLDFDADFDDLYLPLVRYCHRLTGDRDISEDVAQEALVRLFDRKVEGPAAALRAWLFRTATRLVRDRYRVERNRRRLLEERAAEPTVVESPERGLEHRQAIERARRALDALAPRDREMLLMRYEGFRYKEIAEVVGVEATSVGTLLSRAEARFAHAVTAGEDS